MAWLREGDVAAIPLRLRWLMILRIVVVTFLLGMTVLLQIREGSDFFFTPLRGLYFFIGLFYLLTIAYSVAYARGVSPAPFAVFQISVDLVLVSGIVLITGGVESIFSSVYFLSIIGAGILFYRRGCFIVAGMSTVLFGAAAWAPVLPSVGRLVDYQGNYATISSIYVAYQLIFFTFGFFLVAFLASYLAESLRRTGEELQEKTSQFAGLERRNENILQSISSGLLTTDLAGRIVSFNRAAERITLKNTRDIMGSVFGDTFQLRGEWEPFDNLQFLDEGPYRVEGWLRGESEERVFGMTFSLLREEHRIIGIICSFQDVTQIKRMEDQIRRSDRLAVVGELAAGMAHEIRNPLASLSGSIQLLKEELVLEDTNRELMEIVTREVGRLNLLINDFLKFASPRPLQLEMTDLNEMVEETATLLRRSENDAFRIEVRRQGDGGFQAEVDPKLIKQMCWNFSRNAIEAMPGGGVLTLSLEKVPVELKDGQIVDHVEMTFADTGVGIPPEETDRIFTPFHSTKEDGTGLGLAIVFKIVEAHRGKIKFDSQAGEGTVFRVSLPLRQKPAAAFGVDEVA